VSKPKSTKAVIYCRFSPRRNAEECESNETQEHYCRKFCDKHGYEVVGVFADADLSGSDEDRPGLWDAVDALKRGYVLVTYKADRLARGVYLDEAIRRSVAKAGGLVEVVEGSPNGEEPQDVLIRQVLAAFAEYERKVIAARTRAAMRRHQLSGRAMSKLTPFGTREGTPVKIVDGNGKLTMRRTLEPDETEQEILAMILAMHKAGETYRGIARAIEAKGYKPRGATWNHHLVRSIVARYGRDG
jgi:site-specific DNA recombinase